MNKLFWLIYIQPLHRIMIFMILAAVLWGYLGNREQGSRRWRILNAAVFAGIAAVIFYMTICARGEETAEAVLVPFQNFREAREQPEMEESGRSIFRPHRAYPYRRQLVMVRGIFADNRWNHRKITPVIPQIKTRRMRSP